MVLPALAQIAALESRIVELKGQCLSELKARLQAARQTVSDLEKELAKLTGSPSIGTAVAVRRPRTSPEDLRRLVLKALAETPTGLSAKELATTAGLNYQAVLQFLNANPKAFKMTGSARAKRYFLR